MKKIETYEQCSLLIKNFKKCNNKLITNFFYLPKDLKTIIANRKIRYQESKDALIFCVEEKDFFHIFYFAIEESAITLENTEKVMILDLVARNINDSKEIEQEKKIWKSVGFKEYKRYIRLKYQIKQEFCEAIDLVRHKDCELLCAAPIDANAVLNLWETNLDRYSSPLPNNKDMEYLIKSGHIYVIKQKGIVIGAVYMDASTKSCNLRYFAVMPSYRRRGLGTALMNYALRAMALEHIERCYLWVDINNMPAYLSYKKYGFEEDELWSEQLLRG